MTGWSFISPSVIHQCSQNANVLLSPPPPDEEVASLNMIKSAPVGPVAGGIMGCIMVLVLAVYAYRHQIHRRSHQHMSPLAAQGRSPASLHNILYRLGRGSYGRWSFSADAATLEVASFSRCS